MEEKSPLAVQTVYLKMLEKNKIATEISNI
jgi:hypothetical protein